MAIESNRELLIENGIGQLRACLVDHRGPIDILIVDQTAGVTLGNLYWGRIKQVNGALNAAIVSLGAAGDALLPFSKAKCLAPNYGEKGNKLKTIKQCVVEGSTHLFELVREADDSDDKLPLLSAQPSLQGRYVAASLNRKGLNISRDLEGSERKAELTSLLEPLARAGQLLIKASATRVDDEIVAGEAEDLMGTLLGLSGDKQDPGLALEGQTPLERVLNTYSHEPLHRIIFDDANLMTEAKAFAADHWPDMEDQFSLWNGDGKDDGGDARLFEHFGVDDTIETGLTGEISLGGDGGWISIEHTKAATMIDVNAGKGGAGKVGERVAMEVNLSAAWLIIRALRVYNIGGLIIIDFIDMKDGGSISKLLKAMDKGMKNDPLPVERTGISRFGIMQLRRKKTGQSLIGRLTQAQPNIVKDKVLALHLLKLGLDCGKTGGAGTLHLQAPERVVAWLGDNPGALDELASQTHRQVKTEAGKDGGFEALEARLT
jgi:Rne/Rng family ribonuclease